MTVTDWLNAILKLLVGGWFVFYTFSSYIKGLKKRIPEYEKTIKMANDNDKSEQIGEISYLDYIRVFAQKTETRRKEMIKKT